MQYAKKLILEGNKKAARDLNRAIDLLGSDVDPDLIIKRVHIKNQANYKPANPDANMDDAIKYAHQFMGSPCTYYAKCLIESMGGLFDQDKNNLNNYLVEYEGLKKSLNPEELFHLAHEIAVNLVKNNAK